MNRTEPQNQTAQDVTALQVENAFLRRRLEEAQQNEQAMKQAYRDLEALHKPTEDDEAFEKLGEAFATIEEYRDYLPSAMYNEIADALNEALSNDVVWMTEPNLVRQIFPILAKRRMEQETEETKTSETPDTTGSG